jgi:hypothetical protein
MEAPDGRSIGLLRTARAISAHAFRWDQDTGGLEGEDQIGSRKFKALKSRDFVRCTPSVNA